MDVVTSKFDYRQIREIGAGQGLNSVVYLARDPQLGGEIAVKEIPKASFPSASKWFDEAKSMYASDCPNVVPIRVASAATDHICLVMPYLKRGSLQDRIQAVPLSLKECIRVGQGILSGLRQIHIAKIIHLDVKPTNILFADNDDILVADFGQARDLDPTGVSRVVRMYSLGIPPEVFQTGHGSIESDVFQTGLTLYRAVNGHPFWSSEVSACSDLRTGILNGTFPRRDRFLPHVPNWIRRVIRKSLEIDPAKRYRTASELSDALGKDVPLDWRVTVQAPNETVWIAERPARPSVVVRQVRCSKRCNVEVYTESPAGKRRVKDKTVLWRSDLANGAAQAYLKKLFQSLG